MAGQVRVLQLEAGQELETKLFRIEKGKVLVLYKSLIPRSVSKLFENLYLYFRVGWQQIYVGAKLTFQTSWSLSFWCFLRKTGPKDCICTICSMFVLYFRNRNFFALYKGRKFENVLLWSKFPVKFPHQGLCYTLISKHTLEKLGRMQADLPLILSFIQFDLRKLLKGLIFTI